MKSLAVTACVILIPLLSACSEKDDDKSTKSADIPTTIAFFSGADWDAFDSGDTLIGKAQLVCLNANNPPSCSDSATLYNYGGGGWGTDLTQIQNAAWIWAPNIVPDTSLASLAEYRFKKSFQLNGTPDSGNIYIAVDDYAEVYVNGTQVGIIGSTTSQSVAGQGQTQLTNFDITAYLQTGSNEIQIIAINGPDTFSGITNANYSQNPAGVVFGGVLTQN